MPVSTCLLALPSNRRGFTRKIKGDRQDSSSNRSWSCSQANGQTRNEKLAPFGETRTVETPTRANVEYFLVFREAWFEAPNGRAQFLGRSLPDPNFWRRGNLAIPALFEVYPGTN